MQWGCKIPHTPEVQGLWFRICLLLAQRLFGVSDVRAGSRFWNTCVSPNYPQECPKLNLLSWACKDQQSHRRSSVARAAQYYYGTGPLLGQRYILIYLVNSKFLHELVIKTSVTKQHIKSLLSSWSSIRVFYFILFAIGMTSSSCLKKINIIIQRVSAYP